MKLYKPTKKRQTSRINPEKTVEQKLEFYANHPNRSWGVISNIRGNFRIYGQLKKRDEKYETAYKYYLLSIDKSSPAKDFPSIVSFNLNDIISFQELPSVGFNFQMVIG